jgi:hypothetical protein
MENNLRFQVGDTYVRQEKDNYFAKITAVFPDTLQFIQINTYDHYGNMSFDFFESTYEHFCLYYRKGKEITREINGTEVLDLNTMQWIPK